MLEYVGFRHLGVSADNDQVVGLCQPRSSPIDDNVAAPSFRADGISAESLSVMDVVDVNSLMVDDAGGVHEVRVDGAGSFVVQVRLRDRRPVYF